MPGMRCLFRAKERFGHACKCSEPDMGEPPGIGFQGPGCFIPFRFSAFAMRQKQNRPPLSHRVRAFQ